MKTVTSHQFHAVIFLILIAGVPVRAQVRRSREKYISGGFNVSCLGAGFSISNCQQGKPFDRTIGFLAADNGRNNSILAANTSLGLNGSFMWKDRNSDNYTAIGADIQRNRVTYIFKNPYSYSIAVTHPPQDGDADDTDSTVVYNYNKWSENDVSFKYSLSLQRFWYRGDFGLLDGDSYFYIKESFGQSFFHRNQGGSIKVGDTEKMNYDDQDSTSATAKTIGYNPKSFVIGSEIGIRAFTKEKDRTLDVGLAWYMPLKSTYSREYDFYKGTTLLGSDFVNFSGSSILLNVTYNFNYRLKERKVDNTKLEREKIDILAKNHTENGRNFEVQQKVILSSDLVTAKIWDRGTVDGDIITLYLNGEDILDNYTTSKSKKEVQLHLRAGENYLVMYAVNLGKVPPNTASIEIEDGNKPKSITINSDAHKSGALEIVYKP